MLLLNSHTTVRMGVWLSLLSVGSISVRSPVLLKWLLGQLFISFLKNFNLQRYWDWTYWILSHQSYCLLCWNISTLSVEHMFSLYLNIHYPQILKLMHLNIILCFCFFPHEFSLDFLVSWSLLLWVKKTVLLFYKLKFSWTYRSSQFKSNMLFHFVFRPIRAISSDRNKVVSGSDDQSVIVWDKQTSQLLEELKGHDAPVWLLFSLTSMFHNSFPD